MKFWYHRYIVYLVMYCMHKKSKIFFLPSTKFCPLGGEIIPVENAKSSTFTPLNYSEHM